MAHNTKHTKRKVIPNWRSFGNTIALGELNSSLKEFKTDEVNPISSYAFDWKLNKTNLFAGELLSAALIHNTTSNIEVSNAAKHIIINQDSASISQIKLAKKFLDNDFKSQSNLSDEIESISKLDNMYRSGLVFEKIKHYKNKIRYYEFNPINYVELARLYLLVDNEEKSIKNIRIAINLAPDNRYVLRAATRLFIHYHTKQNGYLSQIHKILKKSPLHKIDPWLLSAEISVASLRKKSSNNVKKGIELINSKNHSPLSFTELASAIGTLELENGSNRKSKKLFQSALISPNENSLAQIEWASGIYDGLDIDPVNYAVPKNYEALAIDDYHKFNYEEAIDQSKYWFLDMPFSLRPIDFGFTIASSLLKDQEKAIEIVNAGLISHPKNNRLTNNLAYALALNNQSDEALAQIKSIENHKSQNRSTDICLLATKGLAYFRKGEIDKARELYLSAMEQAAESGNQELKWKAILNYAREEAMLNSEHSKAISSQIDKIKPEEHERDILSLKQDVLDLYEKNASA